MGRAFHLPLLRQKFVSPSSTFPASAKGKGPEHLGCFGPFHFRQAFDCQKMLALTFLYFLVFYLTGNFTFFVVVALSGTMIRF